MFLSCLATPQPHIQGALFNHYLSYAILSCSSTNLQPQRLLSVMLGPSSLTDWNPAQWILILEHVMVHSPYFISLYSSHLSILLLESMFLTFHLCNTVQTIIYANMFNRIYFFFFWIPFVNVLSSFTIQAQYLLYSMGCLFVGLYGSPTARTKGSCSL